MIIWRDGGKNKETNKGMKEQMYEQTKEKRKDA